MTSREMKTIAEELYKLIKKDIKKDFQKYISEAMSSNAKEEWVNTEGAAAYLGISTSTVQKKIFEIPHTKIGRINKFRISDLNEYRLMNSFS